MERDGEQAQTDDRPSLLGAAATTAVARESRRHRRARRRDGRRTAHSRRARGRSLGATADGRIEETVYEPHAASMPPLGPYLTSLWERRHFMVELAKADVRGKSSSTVLGSLWSILDPLFHAAIYFMLFTIIRQGQRTTDFLPVLVGCIFLFQLGTIALNDGGNSIRRSKRLMLNSSFPRAILPLTALLKGVLQFLPSIAVYVGFHVVLDAPVTIELLLLPILFGLQLVLMTGMALLTATLVVFVPDAQNLLRYVTRLLLFTSPVIYPVDLIPDDVRPFLALQPFFPLFAAYQEVLTGNVPDATTLLQVAGWCLVLLFVGARLFLRHERSFALHL